MTQPLRLAHQALNTFDAEGEFAMLVFVQAHLSADSDPSLTDRFDNTETYRLTDGSRVVRQEEQYDFSWHLINRRIHPTTQTRPATEALRQFPVHGELNLPLLPWPHSTTIWKKIISRVEEEQAELLGLDYPFIEDPNLSVNQSYAAAPTLYQEIRKAMLEYNLPQHLLERMEEEAEDCAQSVYDKIPPAELQNLAEAARDQLQNSNEKGTQDN